MTSDQLVNDYLERLDRAARLLPPERREELVADVRRHIADSGATSDVEVQNALERLGTPEEIVAEYDDVPVAAPAWPAPPAEPRLRLREYVALVLLPIGVLVLVIGWFVGVVLLWSSDRWRTWEKVMGTLVLPFGYGSTLLVGSLPGQTCSSTTSSSGVTVESCTGVSMPLWLGIPVLVVLLVAPLVSVAVLALRGAPGRS